METQKCRSILRLKTKYLWHIFENKQKHWLWAVEHFSFPVCPHITTEDLFASFLPFIAVFAFPALLPSWRLTLTSGELLFKADLSPLLCLRIYFTIDTRKIDFPRKNLVTFFFKFNGAQFLDRIACLRHPPDSFALLLVSNNKGSDPSSPSDADMSGCCPWWRGGRVGGCD